MSIIKRVLNTVVKEINEVEMSLTAIVSSGAKDRMDEVLDPAGADLKNYRKNPVVLWAHNYDQPPIGKAMWVKRTEEGIISKVKFASTEFAKEIFTLYKEGFLNAFSVGFLPKEWEDGGEKCNDGKKPRRTYKSWEMLEYSAVPVPANPEALQMAIQRGILKDDCLIEQIQKEMDVTPEEVKTVEKEECEIIEETKTSDETKTVVINPGLDELLAENSLLKQSISGLEKEISELKYKLYFHLTKNQKSLSEIADNVTADKIGGIIDGAIRKALGKVT